MYPSNMFFYCFLSYLKANQIKKSALYDGVYENMLVFAQAIEGNKGTKVKIYKE